MTDPKNYQRFRKVLLNAEAIGYMFSNRLDKRINALLDRSDWAGTPESKTADSEGFLRAMRRIRRELCEIFVDDLAMAIDDNDDLGDILDNLEFESRLYAALDSCVKTGANSSVFDWDATDTLGVYNNLAVNIDWTAVIEEGGGGELLSDWLAENITNEWIQENASAGSNSQQKPMSQKEDQDNLMRPFGDSFESKIEEIISNKPKCNTPQSFIMELAKAMIQVGVDPAFIYAFQKTEVFVTQENAGFLPAVLLAQWDAAVSEYRARAAGKVN
jgi:hypothetical protein